MTWVLGAFCFLVGALAFFSISPTNPRGVPGDLGTLLVIWVILWFAIKKLPRVPLVVKDEFFLFSWKKALGVGLGLYCILDLIPFILSGLHVNSFLFVGYFVGALVLIIRKISKIEVVSSMQMVFVGLKKMIPTALLVIPIGIYSGRQDHVVTSLIFLIIFAVAVKRMRRKLGVLYS